MEVHFGEEPDEIRAVIGDERGLVLHDPFSQRPVRLAAQAKVIDVIRQETSGVRDSNQRLVQTLVDEESHALLSRVLNVVDFRPLTLFLFHGRRLGRPRRGNARTYKGAIAIFSSFKAA